MSFLCGTLGTVAPGALAAASRWEWYAASPVSAAWIVLACLVAVAAAAVNLLPQNIMPWPTRIGLLALRLAGFAILLLMLVQLEVRKTAEVTVAPHVAVLTDTSGSMGLADADGGSRLAAARAFADELVAELDGRTEVARYRFSWRLEADKADKADEPDESGRVDDARADVTAASGRTALMDALRELEARERDLQAVILLTDGNDTAGDRGELVAPLLAARGLPVFPVVFGDPDAPRLARVRVLGGNDYVRLGDELRLVARIAAEGLEEQAVRVRLYEGASETPLASRENVRIGAERAAPAELAFVVRPAKAGTVVYRIVAEGVRGAASDRLLVAEHRVDVVDSRIRALYLDIPRDERKILGHWLARDPVVDLAILTMLPKGGWYAQGRMRHANAGDGIPGKEEDLYKYDVVILGDIPRSYFREGGDVAETKMRWLAEFVARRGGGLVMLGGRSVYAAGQYQGSALASICPFTVEATDAPQFPGEFMVSPTPIGLAHPIMQLEADGQLNREAWFDLPTLDGCNRVGEPKPGATLLAERIEEGASSPLIALQNVGKGKVLALAADTTWRWEMKRPAEGPDRFRRFWGNALRVLAPDPRLNPDRPQVVRYQSSTPVGRTITMATRLVNKTFRPVTGADVRVKVTAPSGRELHVYPRDGRGHPGVYEYEVHLDEPGAWTVETAHKDATATERFVAGEGREELEDPRALPEAMASFAEATGGEAFTPRQAKALAGKLRLTSRRAVETRSIAVWNRPWVMLVMMAIVCLDCLVRKRRGMV